MAKGGARDKVRVHATIDRNIVAWAEANSGPGKKFAHLSHALEFALYRLREQLTEGEPHDPRGGAKR